MGLVRMRRVGIAVLLLLISAGSWYFWRLHQRGTGTNDASSASSNQEFAGAASCRSCHEPFYQKWVASRHGLAMQPFNAEFARKELTPQAEEVKIGAYLYRAKIDPGSGWVMERGPEGEKKYTIVNALGGKNVYYFLTPLKQGRLQTLPVAYDVHKKQWFDTALSGVRHFPGRTEPDEPVHWKEWPYTFNTACFNCHVSQLTTNYDPGTDSYHTVWREPGINCETCHGPSMAHIQAMRGLAEGKRTQDLHLIRMGKALTVEQNNAACAPCHAKMSPLTSQFTPGERYFDHFDLIALENPDYYPDGRDLGENYTYTSWLLSPCLKGGKLSCLHCHTSSGRFRQKENPNQACAPCHQALVNESARHSGHKAGSAGDRCISCHMPMTAFARMNRSDHSMLPPVPAASLAFSSPNACNLCHTDRTSQWADLKVRQIWKKRDYQAPLLARGKLIDAARKREWKTLPAMLTYLEKPERDQVFAASLVRLLRTARADLVLPAILRAARDPSPLVRSAAVETLGSMITAESLPVLVRATRDEFRLVSVRAAASLAGQLNQIQDEKERAAVEKAQQEYIESLRARPDQWISHYNLGNFLNSQGAATAALKEYETASRYEPNSPVPLVNASLLYAQFSDLVKAQSALEKALRLDSNNALAHFNLGLLLAEQQDLPAAESHFRTALKNDPQMAQAAFNLGVLLSNRQQLEEGLAWLTKAAQWEPQPKYGYTLAFYLNSTGKTSLAVRHLKEIISQWPSFADAYFLLGDIYTRKREVQQARQVYEQASHLSSLNQEQRQFLAMRLQALSR
jgi:tetratricopeptide (TPR) repeat protein